MEIFFLIMPITKIEERGPSKEDQLKSRPRKQSPTKRSKKMSLQAENYFGWQERSKKFTPTT